MLPRRRRECGDARVCQVWVADALFSDASDLYSGLFLTQVSREDFATGVAAEKTHHESLAQEVGVFSDHRNLAYISPLTVLVTELSNTTAQRVLY